MSGIFKIKKWNESNIKDSYTFFNSIFRKY